MTFDLKNCFEVQRIDINNIRQLEKENTEELK